MDPKSATGIAVGGSKITAALVIGVDKTLGLGVRAKRTSAYIVMAILGGVVLPKVMGAVADRI